VFPREEDVCRELQCQYSQGNRKCAGSYSASVPRGTGSVQGATVLVFPGEQEVCRGLQC
jgi:hypothetical protein